MPCYKPMRGFRARNGQFTYDSTKAIVKTQFTVPCGQCYGCRLERSRQWAVRMHHESTLYDDNCFITLTYDDQNLPWDHSLNIRHFQLFMKQFRLDIAPRKIRFYHSGEYGQATPENDFIARPHYHAIIFNYNFPDRELFKTEEGINLYTSDYLDSLWNRGFTTVGEMTFESAAYVARYIMKKITGDQAHDHYTRTDYSTGEIIHIHPEYSTMSRKPGIGHSWYEKFKNDAYPSDSLSIRGSVQRPPKYYDYLYDMDPIGDIELIKSARMAASKEHRLDNTDERLAVKEIVKRAQTSNLHRKL